MITGRPYHDDADRDRILRFLSAANVADAPRLRYWHIGDIVWGLYQNTELDPRASLHLWEEEHEVVGFGWFDEPNSFDFQIHPRLLGRGLIEELALAWAADRARVSRDETEGVLHARVRTGFTEIVALLTEQGFERDTRTPASLIERRGYPPNDFYYVHFQHDLRAPRRDPVPPAGWSVRPVGSEAEWQARVDLHRTVWAPSRVTLDAYRRLRTAPVYRPDLDFVAVAPDGRLAAYCICWLDPTTRVAEFEPVGTHPDFRGRGIGRTLLLEAFRRLREAGAETAIVLTNANNVPAVRLYESAGFTIVDTEFTYTRAL